MTAPEKGKRPEYLAFGQPDFSDEEIAAVTRVLRSGWVGMGPETQAFEKELAAFVGAPQVVTVSSCTAAMFLSLVVSGVGPGDEVICPSLTWCSTANVALYLGATPVFCDVESETLCATPKTVAACVTPKTKAAICVHLAGLAADIGGIRSAIPRTVALIEDAAHALGARYADGKNVGSSGNLACFSSYANKNLSTGEGGAVAVSDDSAAEKLRSLRQHGLPVDAWKRFTHPQSLLFASLETLGYKMNYTDLQACIGRVQLRRQPEFHTRRIEIARYYRDRFAKLPVKLQVNCTHESHSRHLFLALLPIEKMKIDRNAFVLAMRARNIGASVHYAPLHQMPLYSSSPRRDLPVTEWLCQRIVTLPISARMTLDDARDAADAFEDILVNALEK